MLTLEQKKEKLRLKRLKKILRCRISFWEYQKNNSPNDFNDKRTYLICLSLALQSFYQDKPVSYLANHPIEHHLKLDLSATTIPIKFKENGDKTLITVDASDTDILIIEVPPRHHKSHTLINFEDWVLGKDNKQIMITASYNANLANEFSQYVRDGIEEIRIKPFDIIYSDIFPKTKTKHGDRSKTRWALEGSFLSFTGSGILTGVTGKGGNLIVIDDAIKGYLESMNENHLDKVWNSYTNSWLSRLEKPRKQISVATPWVIGDLNSRIIDGAEKSGEKVKVFNCPAYSESQGVLCEDILDKRAIDILQSRLDPVIFSGNYLCKRLPLAGMLYTSFNFYTVADMPKQFDEVWYYVDTADEGKDYLSAGVAGIINCKDSFGLDIKNAYILDVYYTQDGMDITENETVEFLVRNNIQKNMSGLIESNAGGRGFARNIERILRQKYPKEKILINWFHQSENKKARINTQSNTVMKHFYFPKDWRTRSKSWKEFSESMMKYSKDGKNTHDDAQDMISGISEHKVNTEMTMLEALKMRRNT